MISQIPSLWAFEEDILSRSWVDWLVAHVSLGKPLHRFEGMLTVHDNFIQLTGKDKRTKQDFYLQIVKYEIEQLYLGFDEIFCTSETRGLGISPLSWLPLRISFTKNEEERKLYLIVNYQFGKSDNTEYFEFLKQWVSY